MFAFKRNRIIREKIGEYLDVVNQALDLYGECMRHYLAHQLDDRFEELMAANHAAESKADDLRREIEGELFEKSLLPEVREDICHIIERMDRLPNKCEKILQRLYSHGLILPPALHAKVLQMSELGVETGKMLKDAVLDVLGPCREIQEVARRVDVNESAADELEHELVYQVFHEEYDPWDRLMYRDIVAWIADLCDLAQDICDSLTVFAIKRNV